MYKHIRPWAWWYKSLMLRKPLHKIAGSKRQSASLMDQPFDERLPLGATDRFYGDRARKCCRQPHAGHSTALTESCDLTLRRLLSPPQLGCLLGYLPAIAHEKQ